MGSNVPLIIVIAILAVTAVTVLVAVFVRERKTYAGYEDIQPDILTLKSKLDAEVFRDGADLVVSGSENKVPVVVRFSYAENTPGMNIRVYGPSMMNLAVIPKNSPFYFPENLRVNVNTPEDQFNSRFITRSDDGSAARMFLMGRSIMREMQKALCSSRTTLHISKGSLELTETTIPQPATGRHVAGHIESLLAMNAMLAKMPGAELSQVERPSMPNRWVTRAAIGMGAIAALLTIVGATRQMHEPTTTELPTPTGQFSVAERGAGVTAVDAKVITELDNYRVVTPPEFDPNVSAWIKSHGVEPTGRIELNLKSAASEDNSEPQNVAYLMRDPQGKRRLVILDSGRVIFDTRNYPPMSILKVPANAIPAASTEAVAPPIPQGDGILVVQDEPGPQRSFLLFMSKNAIVRRDVPNWTDIALR